MFTFKQKERAPLKKAPFVLSLIITMGVGFTVNAADASYDTLSFKPANDQGYYLVVEQSKTLPKGQFALGVMGDYSRNSLRLQNADGSTFQKVIDQQIAVDIGAAFGITNWLNMGVNIDGVPYQEFSTPGTGAEDNGSHLGDILLNLKAQLLDTEKYSIGLAVVPFVTLPTGDGDHFVGNGKVTGGGKIVLDSARINDRLSFSLNAGGQIRESVLLSPGAQTIDDEFLFGGAVNLEVAKPLQFIAEVTGSTPFDNFFEDDNTNMGIDGALRFIPNQKNLQLTVGGGAGLLKLAGEPDYHVFASLALRPPKKEKVKPAPVYIAPPEEVINTNDIHFASGKAVIRSDSKSVIDDIYNDIINRTDVVMVRVEGHTDSVGTDEYNQKLSQARANAVRIALISRGFPASKITAVGMGEMTPIGDNLTKDGRAQNRRVEFHLELQQDSKVKVKENKTDSPTYQEGDNGKSM